MRTVRVAVLLSLVCHCVGLRAQDPGTAGPRGEVQFTGRAAKGSIALHIASAPDPGDFLTVVTTSNQIDAVLLTPAGRRVSARTAAAAGLDWERGYNMNPPLGRAADPGHYLTITFERAGAAGVYVLEFAAGVGAAPNAKAQAWFTSRMQEYRRLMRSVPGARMPAAVPMHAGATIAIDVERDADCGIFDIVTPDATDTVTVTRPDGRILRRGEDDDDDDVSWMVSEKSGEVPMQAKIFDALGLMLPGRGIHHVVTGKVVQGRYEIHAGSAGAQAGALTAAFFSLTELENSAAGDEIRRKFNPGEPAANGEVRIQPRGVSHEGFAGGHLEVAVGVVGDVGAEPPAFEVRIENVPAGTWSAEHPLGRPDAVQSLPVRLVRGADGDYHGTVPLAKAGRARIEIRATGKRATGEPFSDRVVIEARVHPVVARVVSMDARGVDADGDGRFDRLEITAQLDVQAPGEYLLPAQALSQGRTANAVAGVQTLVAGRQSLTASIAAAEVWSVLGGGSYEIRGGTISLRPADGQSATPVPESERVFHTAVYRREQWDHGPIYGEDEVRVQGIRAAPSGRFRLAEVTWDVTTPGGRCAWWAGAYPTAGPTGAQPGNFAELPAGRQRLVFLIDGAAIAGSKGEWNFEAQAECPGRPGHATLPKRKLTIDPAQYEPYPGTLTIEGESALRWTSDRSWSTTLFAFGKRGADIHLSLAEVPAGLDAQMAPRGSGTRVWADLKVAVSPEIAPGRYFLRVAAASGTEITTRDLVVDVR